MSGRLRDERGGVLALSAILIPVFLVLAAFVIDVGQWYSHKRQLQNRADAAAFAAGIEYAKNWKPCVQTSNATLQADAARVIANAARQYAADPEAADYAPDSLPTPLYNANVANQAKLDVIINSTTYTDDTDYTDGGAGPPPPGNPCFDHDPDAITPSGGHWVDVRVRENDLPSLFGSIGLPLAKNVARARIEIHPALSGNKFLPLAVPNNVIEKVQVRYYDECRDPGHTSPLNPPEYRDLAPLVDPADNAAFISDGGGMLWALPNLSDPDEGDRTRSFPLTVPSYGGCGQDYLPIGVEVRLASTDTVDLNQSCATLIAAKFADCFSRLSQFRVYNDGNADSQARLTNVKILGGCGGPGDSYFGPLPIAALDCSYDVSAEVDWGTRDNPPNDVDDNFIVSANGTPLDLQSWSTPNGTAIYASSGGTFTSVPGANDVTISLAWADDNPTHSWGGAPCVNPPGPADNPCRYNATEAAHRTFVGTRGNAGAVALVRTSQSGFVSGRPGPPLENVATGGSGGTPPSPIQVYPTVGTRSVLKTGVLTTLRLDDPQANQTLRCDPDYAQGQEFSAFLGGCKPWYGANAFTDGPWWNTTTKQCPLASSFFSYATMPPPYGLNSKLNPWRCVPTAPGMATGQIGDYMAGATDNCSNIQTNSCQNVDCLIDGNYDGKSSPLNPLDPGWVNRTNDTQGPRGTLDPRVVNLFIIPYQSLKGSTGGDPEETVPILGFASFYVFNWTGSNAAQSDQCPDTTFDHDKNPGTAQITIPDPPRGAITGVFVEAVDYESGPVDPTITCTEGQLTPCRASLTR